MKEDFLNDFSSQEALIEQRVAKLISRLDLVRQFFEQKRVLLKIGLEQERIRRAKLISDLIKNDPKIKTSEDNVSKVYFEGKEDRLLGQEYELRLDATFEELVGPLDGYMFSGNTEEFYPDCSAIQRLLFAIRRQKSSTTGFEGNAIRIAFVKTESSFSAISLAHAIILTLEGKRFTDVNPSELLFIQGVFREISVDRKVLLIFDERERNQPYKQYNYLFLDPIEIVEGEITQSYATLVQIESSNDLDDDSHVGHRRRAPKVNTNLMPAPSVVSI